MAQYTKKRWRQQTDAQDNSPGSRLHSAEIVYSFTGGDQCEGSASGARSGAHPGLLNLARTRQFQAVAPPQQRQPTPRARVVLDCFLRIGLGDLCRWTYFTYQAQRPTSVGTCLQVTKLWLLVATVVLISQESRSAASVSMTSRSTCPHCASLSPSCGLMRPRKRTPGSSKAANSRELLLAVSVRHKQSWHRCHSKQHTLKRLPEQHAMVCCYSRWCLLVCAPQLCRATDNPCFTGLLATNLLRSAAASFHDAISTCVRQ